jgi:type IV secretion system protein VirB10
MKRFHPAGLLMCSTLLAVPITLTAQPSQSAPQTPMVVPTAAAGMDAAAASSNAKSYTVPAGTKVLLSLKSGVNTKTARPGDGVYLVSTFPVIVGSRVLIPSGVYVQGVVDKVDRPGRVKGRAKLLMHFTTMIFPNGQVVGIPGTVNDLPGSGGPSVKGEEGTIEQAGSKGKDAGQVLKGGMIGATGGVIGGAASGDPGAGAAVGGLAGVAGGLIYTLFTRGDEIVIPEGTSLEMVMQRPLELQPSQLAGINDVRGNPQYIPSGGQAQPLSKPAHILCPSGSLGCN